MGVDRIVPMLHSVLIKAAVWLNWRFNSLSLWSANRSSTTARKLSFRAYFSRSVCLFVCLCVCVAYLSLNLSLIFCVCLRWLCYFSKISLVWISFCVMSWIRRHAVVTIDDILFISLFHRNLRSLLLAGKQRDRVETLETRVQFFSYLTYLKCDVTVISRLSLRSPICSPSSSSSPSVYLSVCLSIYLSAPDRRQTDLR